MNLTFFYLLFTFVSTVFSFASTVLTFVSPVFSVVSTLFISVNTVFFFFSTACVNLHQYSVHLRQYSVFFLSTVLNFVSIVFSFVNTVLEFLNNLWGQGTELEQGCCTGPPQPVFVNVCGAQDSILRNQFCQARNQFLGSIKGLQIWAQATQAGGIDSLECILGLHKKFNAQYSSLCPSEGGGDQKILPKEMFF